MNRIESKLSPFVGRGLGGKRWKVGGVQPPKENGSEMMPTPGGFTQKLRLSERREREGGNSRDNTKATLDSS